jgi:undecaprenyl-diphosphatase
MGRTLSRSRTFWREARRLRSTESRLLVLGIVFVIAGTAGLFLLGESVLRGETQRFDEWAVDMLRDRNDPSLGRGPHWLRGAVRDVTALGSTTIVSIVSLIVLGFALLRRNFRLAVVIFGAAGGGLVLNTLLKELYDRPRPALPHVAGMTSFSFPSGHAMVSATIYLALAAVLAVREERLVLRAYLLAVGCALALMVGLSRIYLGVHYPTDVLGGWLAGVIWAVLCALASWATRRAE